MTLSRKTPMKRKPFATPRRLEEPKKERTPVLLRPIRVPLPQVATLPVSTPKREYVRSEDYRRYVAALPCWRCGVEDFSNACHSDSGADGKGGGIKACDLTCWPGCVERLGVVGCHSILGSNTRMSRADKRETEQRAAAETQAKLIDMAQGDAKLRKVLETVGLL